MNLDHFYISLNQSEFDTFKNQKFVKENFEYRNTVRPDISYEGLYIYFCDNTYFEVVSDSCGIPRGTVGIAGSNLESNIFNPSFEVEKEMIKLDGKNWFEAFNKPFIPDLYAWIMIYQGEFIEKRKSYYKEKAKSVIGFTGARIKTKLSENEVNSRLEIIENNFKNGSVFKKIDLKFNQSETKLEVDVVDAHGNDLTFSF